MKNGIAQVALRNVVESMEQNINRSTRYSTWEVFSVFEAIGRGLIAPPTTGGS
jgi:hypothetical protein